jgi:hypothetical protein
VGPNGGRDLELVHQQKNCVNELIPSKVRFKSTQQQKGRPQFVVNKCEEQLFGLIVRKMIRFKSDDWPTGSIVKQQVSIEAKKFFRLILFPEVLLEL